MLQLTKCRSELHVLLRDLRQYSPSTKADGRFGEGTVRDALKALVLWVIEGDGGRDAPFPFSLPHLEFAKRCRRVSQQVALWVCRPRSIPETRALACLERLAAKIERDPRFAPTVDDLDMQWKAFCELRDVLRLPNAELPRGDLRLNQNHLPALELLRLKQIKQAVDQYTTDLEGRILGEEKQSKKPTSASAIILKYLRPLLGSIGIYQPVCRRLPAIIATAKFNAYCASFLKSPYPCHQHLIATRVNADHPQISFSLPQ
jgi:hypothetical protein